MPWLTFTGFDPPLHVPLYREREPLADLQRRLNRLSDSGFNPFTFGPECEIVCVWGGSTIRLPWRARRRDFAINGKAPSVNGPMPLRHGDTLLLSHEAEFHDPAAAPLPAGAEGLFRAVLDAPADEGLRLILADWLEERGTPEALRRAELIRLQVDLDRDPPFGPDDPLSSRVAELLAENDAAWAGPELLGLVDAWEFRRGFVEAVTIDAEALGQHSDALFAAAPVRDVRLAGRDPAPYLALAAGDALKRVEAVSVAGPGMGPAEALYDLLARGDWPRLRRLELPLSQEYRSVEALGARLTALEALRAPGLTELCLTAPDWAPVHLPLALRLPPFRGLSVLRLAGLRGGRDGGVGGLAEAPCLPHLAELDVRRCYLGVEGFRRLLAALPAGQLRRLNLEKVGIGTDEANRLAASPALENLTELSVAGNPAYPRGHFARVLAGSTHLARLERLDLRATNTGDAGALALAEAGNLPRLRCLDLRDNSLSAPERAALERGLQPGLRVLF
jgi:uncharacterized protein (TIGR02996 family)